jgi:hypothetical protein
LAGSLAATPCFSVHWQFFSYHFTVLRDFHAVFASIPLDAISDAQTFASGAHFVDSTETTVM